MNIHYLCENCEFYSNKHNACDKCHQTKPSGYFEKGIAKPEEVFNGETFEPLDWLDTEYVLEEIARKKEAEARKKEAE